MRRNYYNTKWNTYIHGHGVVGRKASPETLEKMRNANLGRRLSEETKQKMSLAHKGKKKSEETRRRMSLAFTGRKYSPEVCRQRSLARLGKPGHPHTLESIEKIRRSLTGLKRSRKTREKIRLSWKDASIREKRLKGIYRTKDRCPTTPEKELQTILKLQFPGEYKYVGDGKVWIGYRNPDFINVNGQKKVIELFGSYWHSKKRTGISNTEHRRMRQAHFARYNYKCCIVWQWELENPRKLQLKLRRFHNV